MEFYLIHNRMVNLNYSKATTRLPYDSTMVARSIDLPVNITHKNGSSFQESCCEELRRRVLNAEEKCLGPSTKTLPSPPSDGPKKIWTVTFTLAATTEHSSVGYHRHFVQLSGAGQDNLLTAIESVVVGLGYKFALKVKIHDVHHYLDHGNFQFNHIECMEAKGSVEDFGRSGSPSNDGCLLIHGGIISACGNWGIGGSHTHICRLTVIGCIKPNHQEIANSFLQAKPLATNSSLTKLILDDEMQTDTVANVSQDIQVKCHRAILCAQSLNKLILDDEIQADTVLNVSENIEIKCHRAILCAQSSVFRAMFKDTYEESKTGIVHIEDMTESGVRAFLEYLYYFSISKPTENCGIAVELFKAGHKYDVESLETEMSNIILAKDESWFDLENTVALFRFLKHLDGYAEIKLKAVKYLKANFTGFKNSGSFKKMFQEEPDAAMELCELLCKADLSG